MTIHRLPLLPVIWALALLAGGQPVHAADDRAGIDFFEKKIRPVLVQHCYKCHSAEAAKNKKLKGALLLDTRDGVRRGGETGHAVVPGSPGESLLLKAIRYVDEDMEMPPGKKLPDAVIADFAAWIKMGAPDPREGKATAGGKRVINIEEGRKFWAFQQPQAVEPGAVKDAAWARSPIDRFVLAGIEEHGLKPVRDATAVELLRRVYFDLTGLPPAPADVDKWAPRLTASAKSDDRSRSNGGSRINQAALAELIDTLLASPRFGERWGRHWLDVARYADSNGNVDNVPFPNAWRYRNYVIDAVNADKPYDQFITEQLAGDLLPFTDARQRNEQLIATGFLALGSKPRPQNNPNYQMDVVAEQIEVLTSAMMGLTVGCARCHDHKFDPVPTAEYYGLAGIFTSTKTMYGSAGKAKKKNTPKGGLIDLLPVEARSADEAQKYAQSLARLTGEQRQLTSMLARLGVSDDANDNGAGGKRAGQVKKLKAKLAKLQAAGNKAAQIERVKAQLAKLGAGDKSDRGAKNNGGDRAKNAAQIKTLKTDLAQVEAELASLRQQAPQAGGEAMGAVEGSPGNCAICLGGESTERGPVVPRGFISVATLGQAPTIGSDQSGRLQLAQWIASPDNPLTARVMVNRIWHYLIGRGIVSTVDNFGQLGDRPTHPQLLDWLAVQFVKDGWSVKRMIRTVMLSRTYQMSSAHDAANYAQDPDNTWYWRMQPRRLDAESLRDAILAFSGELDLSRPGPPDLGPANKKQAPQARTEGNHRSVYLPIVRNGEPEALALFDFADPSIVVGDRQETTVPAQSLFLLNSPFVVQQSRAAAQRILAIGKAGAESDAQRIDAAFMLAYAHRPTDAQRQRALYFLRQTTEAMAGNESKGLDRQEAAWAAFCQSLIASAQFRYLD